MMDEVGYVRKQMESLLQRFTYKPGWEFHLYSGNFGVGIDFRINVIDADQPDRTIMISAKHVLSPRSLYDESYLITWLRTKIIEIERHETDEFFQFDGVKIFDPH